jgi:hypothetical protein
VLNPQNLIDYINQLFCLLLLFIQMSGISQGASGMGGNAGELDGQGFAVGTASKDQRANKEALLKMTRNKRQAANKTPSGQQAK